MPISQDLLDILACPACKTPVKLTGEELVMLIEDGDKGRDAAKTPGAS
jgi:uncharacterized protein YbaR (Trm112 family)